MDEGWVKRDHGISLRLGALSTMAWSKGHRQLTCLVLPFLSV